MIISESYFGVAILATQQSFLQMETKLIERTYPLLSLVFQKIRCAHYSVFKKFNQPGKIWKPYFPYPTGKGIGIVYSIWIAASNLNRSNNNTEWMHLIMKLSEWSLKWFQLVIK